MADIVERAFAFVRRKYVARSNRGILYVEAAQDDLAKEIARFTEIEIARLLAVNHALHVRNNGLRVEVKELRAQAISGGGQCEKLNRALMSLASFDPKLADHIRNGG